MAFELSERNGIPVMVRLTTRLSHSRSVVETDDEPMAQNKAALSRKSEAVGIDARYL